MVCLTSRLLTLFPQFFPPWLLPVFFCRRIVGSIVGVAVVAAAVMPFAVVAVGVGEERGSVVQHEAGDRGPHRLEQLFHALGGVGRDAAGLDHHHDQVGQGGQERGVGDRDDRRGVEDDHVIAGAKTGQQVAHSVGTEQFRRIRGDDAGGQQGDVVDAGRVQCLGQRGIPGQYLGHAGIPGMPEDLVQARPAQVAVDQQDPVAGLGEGQGQ
ncbi:MAG: hypothetical protein H6Q41_619, partial [Deltaproteobacteria bacterium]|nr:hypothetical protein [Deltaproteobacteria bacterium]